MPQRTLPDGSVTHAIEEFDYNASGQLIEHRQNGCIHRFEYETAGLVAGYSKARSHSKNGVVIRETFQHDSVGNLTSRTDGEGNRQEYTIDAYGRVAIVRLADGSLWNFEYDGSSRLTAAVESHPGAALRAGDIGPDAAETDEPSE